MMTNSVINFFMKLKDRYLIIEEKNCGLHRFAAMALRGGSTGTANGNVYRSDNTVPTLYSQIWWQ
jgi:hypothetical protein